MCDPMTSPRIWIWKGASTRTPSSWVKPIAAASRLRPGWTEIVQLAMIKSAASSASWAVTQFVPLVCSTVPASTYTPAVREATIRQSLNNLDDAETLEPPPAQLWIYLCMEITIRSGGDDYLIVRQPHYSDIGLGADGDVSWAPPFLAIPVLQTFDLATSGEVLTRCFDRTSESLNVNELIRQRLYEMGLENPSIEERTPVTEVRSPSRNMPLVRALKMRRFGITCESLTSKMNLADPDGRKGFVYLPLNNERYRPVPPTGDPDPSLTWRYLGLPLCNYLALILSSRSELRSMRRSAVPLESSHFSRDREGWLLNFDLSGYGRAVQYVNDNMHSLEEDGPTLAAFFRSRLAEWFALFLGAVGAREVQHTGDGFLCALPNEDDPVSILTLLSALKKLQDDVDSITRALPSELRLGSRTALNYGTYRYGRVGGPMSSTSGFDGAPVVAVVRMEQGLRHLVKSGKLRELGLVGRHFVVTSLEAEPANHVLEEQSWTRLDHPESLISKEFAEQGWVWARESVVAD
jgi:hypothetical protein